MGAEAASSPAIEQPVVHEVLLFAGHAEAFGGPSVRIALPPTATVEDLRRAVRALPAGHGLPGNVLVAVNQAMADGSQRLAPGDEVALIPPVAGG